MNPQCLSNSQLVANFWWGLLLLVNFFETQAATFECLDLYRSQIITHVERPLRRRIDVKKRSPVVEQIESDLRQSVIAQPQMIMSLARALVRAKVGIQRRGTMGNILIYGPTGIGKTKSAEELARLIDGELIEIEGGDYQTEGSVTSLTGVGPMWAGHGKSLPILTPARIKAAQGKKVPVTIILLNELEKAHSDFLDWWLKALDKGVGEIWIPNETVKVGDNNPGGKTTFLDLRNTIVIATTNAAAEIVKSKSKALVNEIKETSSEVFRTADGVGDLSALKDPNNLNPIDNDTRMALLAEFKRPEFLGRWDDITAAYPLLDRGYKRIVNLEVQRITKQFQNAGEKRNLKLRLTRRAAEWIVSNIDHNFGARNLSKIMDSQIELAITNAIASGEISGHSNIAIDLSDHGGGLAFFTRNSVSKAESLHFATVERQRKTEEQRIPEEQRKAEELKKLADPKESQEKEQERKRREANIAEIERRELKLTEIGNIQDPKERLEAINIFTRTYSSYSLSEIFKILTITPSGVGWGWKDLDVYKPNKIMKDLGLQDYKVGPFEYIDISIVFAVLQGVDTKIKDEQIPTVRLRAHQIIKSSLKMNQKDLPETYLSNLLLAVEALIHSGPTPVK